MHQGAKPPGSYCLVTVSIDVCLDIAGASKELLVCDVLRQNAACPTLALGDLRVLGSRADKLPWSRELQTAPYESLLSPGQKENKAICAWLNEDKACCKCCLTFLRQIRHCEWSMYQNRRLRCRQCKARNTQFFFPILLFVNGFNLEEIISKWIHTYIHTFVGIWFHSEEETLRARCKTATHWSH